MEKKIVCLVQPAEIGRVAGEIGMGCGSSVLDGGVMDHQEAYVSNNFAAARASLATDRVTDRQIEGKLRNEYHGVVNDEYVLRSSWEARET